MSQTPALLLTLSDGIPPVTGTGTFDQAPASWDATASEKIIGTAGFIQAGTGWSGVASEIVTGASTYVQPAASWGGTSLEIIKAQWPPDLDGPVGDPAAWTQDVGGAPIYVDETHELLRDQDGVAIIGEDGSGFLGLGLVKTALAGTFAQDQSWDALASEAIPGTATWSQSATWDAIVTETESGTAAFDQAAAAWSGEAVESIPASGEFTQAAAAWGSEVTVTDGEPQPEPVAPAAGHHRLPAYVAPQSPPRPASVVATASFTTPPARWAATGRVNDDDLVLEVL